MKRRNLHQSTHPFDPHPFEAYWCGSWQTVERLRIRDGAIIMHIIDNEEVIEERITISNLRIRSRKATLSDCTCFLRPGLDICVLSTPPQTEDSDDEDPEPVHTESSGDENPEPVHTENPGDENLEPVWIDAKISSIERKPHEVKCACQFYVNVFTKQGPAGMKKKALSKETTLVPLDQISILQRLEKNPCDSMHYRWRFSEDCISHNMPKLFTGKFSSDLTWLLVASVYKQLVFDVKSIENQIVYQIWDGDEDPLKPENHSTAVNFKVDDGISVPILVPFVPVDPVEKGSDCDMNDVGPLSFYDLMDLRRSKRRYVQPERYVGCVDLPESDVDVSRVGMYKTCNEEYEEIPLALSIQDDHAFKSEKRPEDGKRVYSCRKESKDLYKNFLSYQRKIKSNEVKSVVADKGARREVDQGENQSQLAIVPLPLPAETRMLVHEENPLNFEVPEDHSRQIIELISEYKHINGFPRVNRINGFPRAHRKKILEENFLKPEGGWEWTGLHKKARRRREYHISSKRESIYDARTSIRRSYSARVYREMIRRCMENIEDVVNKEESPIIYQWKEFRASNFLDPRDSNEMPTKDNEEESSDTEILWKEMEFSMQSMYVLEDSEDPSEVQKPEKDCGQVCRHDYRLDEEIGILCRLCGFVSTEIRDVTPPFLPSTNLITNKEPRTEDNSEQKLDEDGSLDLFCIPSSSNAPLSEGHDNVWALIPDLKEKLRFHQKRAFEFLWRNIAGSLEPALMESARKERGGCVISHSPGAGKTLLIIAFLVSYLKLFPGSRPLVLAPKTTLYTWYKEIIKWNIPIPVYQIHGGRTYKDEVSKQKVKLAPGVPCDQNVMHVLDCLEKIQKWLSQPSVLLMGYTSFVILTREDSKHAHRQYMCQVLRQCPGVLILDEGHNPRSTKSRLRKGLMKINTSLRILLSGTLFQNNFGEYFNTLCLARPSFVTEVLTALDPKFKSRKKGAKTRFSLENRARKLFIQKVGDRIDSSVPEERLEALNMLKNLTSGFIDVYEGGGSECLPGLQCYTCMMKSTTIQQDILSKLQNLRPQYKGFPLELELLITLGSIHPWLIKTTSCATQYFDVGELQNLEKTKFELKLGSKVRFVMSLVPKCLLRKEKVLIFCHNIAPINLFVDIFERVYAWQKGKEVLVLQGDVELFERGRIMDKFEDPRGASKVMLASINACAEGISLTAASRVILLDSEWNPSKSKQAIARAFRPGQDKIVYVYQLLANGTLEEEKYRRTTWKEWVSNLIFSEEHVEDPCRWEAPKIEDELLREIVEEDRAALFHTIMKNEKASNGLMRAKE